MKSLLVMLVLALVPAAALADWGPDPILSSVWLSYSGPEPVSLFVRPDGGGPSFSQAMMMDGYVVDATVHAQLINYNGDPYVAYPAEDIWIEAADGGLVFCQLGTCPDGPTDDTGTTTWQDPPLAGGSSQAGAMVYVNGAPLTWTVLDLHFNSADLNGDLAVNLTDVGMFASDFFSYYHYRSDFHCDGVINISDLGRLAQSMQAHCP